MQVSETTKQEIRELALLYKDCLEATRDTIGPDILSRKNKEYKLLQNEDYRNIATSIFIELNRQHGRDRNHTRAEAEPSTDKQQAFIGGLAAKGGKKAENIIAQFLDTNEIKLVDKLSKTQATTLINMLKEGQ